MPGHDLAPDSNRRARRPSAAARHASPWSSGSPRCIGGGIAVGGAFKDDFTVPGIESQKAQDLLEQRFPAQSGTQATLVFSSESGAAIDSALKKIERQPHVVSVDKPRVSDNGRIAYTTVSYDQTATDLDASARERLEDATAAGMNVAMSGEPIDGAATGGFPIGELIGLGIAVLLLIAVLRNLRAAGNALFTAFAGIALRLRRADVGRLRHRRARPGADARRHARPRRRHRLRAADLRPPAGRAARRPHARRGRRCAPTRPPATPRSPPPASCSSRSPACSSPASRSSATPASPPAWSCSPAPIICVVLLPARVGRSGTQDAPAS